MALAMGNKADCCSVYLGLNTLCTAYYAEAIRQNLSRDCVFSKQLEVEQVQHLFFLLLLSLSSSTSLFDYCDAARGCDSGCDFLTRNPVVFRDPFDAVIQPLEIC